MNPEKGAADTPRSTAEARRAINETRGRIARDLDAVEDGIAAKKEKFSRKLRLHRARNGIRQHPWWSVAGGLGAGLVLGLLRSVTHKSEREKTRARREHQREERRKRLARHETGSGKARPSNGHKGMGRSMLGTLGGAVAAGLADRVKRKGTDALRNR